MWRDRNLVQVQEWQTWRWTYIVISETEHGGGPVWRDANLVQEFETHIMDLSSFASVSTGGLPWSVTWKLTWGIRQGSSWRLGYVWNLKYFCPSKKQKSNLAGEIRVTKSEFQRQTSSVDISVKSIQKTKKICV